MKIGEVIEERPLPRLVGFSKHAIKPGRIAQWVEALAAKIGDLNSISRSYKMDEREYTLASCSLATTKP